MSYLGKKPANSPISQDDIPTQLITADKIAAGAAQTALWVIE